ncbi:hypothetical protein ACFS27_13985 [Promicromonospora vindobonensis]|uniref:Uncharacterized protein n=1 Tax=Promicromonospora vindobonensis TaxID=195748 RepID=A0ABW5VWI5_9MICO
MGTAAGDAEGAIPERIEAESVPEGRPVVPRARTHFTGAELESRFAGWAKRQRETAALTREAGPRVFRHSLVALMGLGLLALVVAAGVTGERYDAARAQNEAQIVDLEELLTRTEADGQGGDAAGQLSALIEAAAADAEQVATAQQTFAELYREASTQPGPNNGAPNRAMLNIAEHRRRLAPLFSHSSYLVQDEQAYSWSTATSFDATSEIDPRYAWYIRYEGPDAADPRAYTWVLEAALPDVDSLDTSGVTDRAQAVWLCRDAATDEVLAWASARYTHDGTAGAFDRLEVVTTAAGAQYRRGSSPPQDRSAVPEIAADLGGQDKNSGGN